MKGTFAAFALGGALLCVLAPPAVNAANHDEAVPAGQMISAIQAAVAASPGLVKDVKVDRKGGRLIVEVRRRARITCTILLAVAGALQRACTFSSIANVLLVVAIARYDSSSRLASHPATSAKLHNLFLRGA